jgi:hypothetical protein
MKPIEVALLRLVIEGVTDPLDIGVPQRLMVLRAMYGADPTVGPLVREAWDALIRAQERADRATDEAFLTSLADGSADYFADDLYDRLAPLHEKYRDDPAMLELFNAAATIYGDIVVAAAQQTLATLTAQELINRAMGRGEFE